MSGQRLGEPEQITFHDDQRVHSPRFIREGRELLYGVTRSATTIWTSDADRFEEGVPLTRGRNPRLSHDGNDVYFIGEIPGRLGLYVMSREKGVPLQLTADVIDPECMPHKGYSLFGPWFDVAPDDTAVAYGVMRSSKAGKGAALCVLSTAGGSPREVARTESPVRPRWSPDGAWLAYTQGDGMYVVPPDGSSPPRLLARLEQWEPIVEWSPRGDHLAAFGYPARIDVEKERNAIFAISFPGGEMRRVTSVEESSWKEGLVWHPSGEFLSYVDYGVDDDSQIRFAFPDGRPSELAIQQPGHWDYFGEWTPDGKRLFFHSYSNEPEASDVHVFDLERREVVEHGSKVRGSCPGWSPQGEVVVWTTHSSNGWFQIQAVR